MYAIFGISNCFWKLIIVHQITNSSCTYAVNCGNLSQVIIETGSISIMGYHNPPILGANATFGCPFDKKLIGPNLTTCMENGEWEPDPRSVECKGYHYNHVITVFVKYVYVRRHRKRDP